MSYVCRGGSGGKVCPMYAGEGVGGKVCPMYAGEGVKCVLCMQGREWG